MFHISYQQVHLLLYNVDRRSLYRR